MRGVKKILLYLFLGFILFSFVKNIFDYQKSLSFYQNSKSDFEKEKKQNIELKTWALKNSDSFEKEKIIRNKLNLSKGDEVSLIIPKPTSVPVKITPTATPVYMQWWKTFF